MKDLFWNEYVSKTYQDSKFYTLIQVLPKADNIYQMKWKKEENKNIAISDRNEISAQFLVSVKFDWYKSETCPFCFSDNPRDEKSIIQTSKTSIVSIQMITSFPQRKNIEVFDAVIIFLSRILDSSKMDYVRRGIVQGMHFS